MKKTFGPVPSRRLGRSLGINTIPPKVCSYSCVYCQVGRTKRLRMERGPFYSPAALFRDVQRRVEEARTAGESIDYLTIVPDGEPTLDSALGRELDYFRRLDIKIAVITNGSLIWQDEVRRQLAKADWVSLKVDAVETAIWKKINRPHGVLRLEEIKKGMHQFAETFSGELVTETMLVAGVNDDETHLSKLAEFLGRLCPSKAYLSVPTRPPAETWVHPPDEDTITRAYQIVSEHVECVEYLIGYEGNAFASTGDVEDDLLSITAVHPMREEAVNDLLGRTQTDWSTVERLVAEKKLVSTQYRGRTFYTRKIGAKT